MDVAHHPSPNCGPRRDGLLPNLVVIHYTAMDSGRAALERLCDPAAEVSAHYLIYGDGKTVQMVDEAARAWHAGAGDWCGCGDVNSRSIGIELDNRGTHPFFEPQMTALEALLGRIMARWDIKPCGVIGHSDIAPDRKSDPGPRFDWRRLERRGLAAPATQRELGAGDEAAFLAAARDAGFTADVDVATLLAATRLRHAPWRRGPLCPQDFIL